MKPVMDEIQCVLSVSVMLLVVCDAAFHTRLPIGKIAHLSASLYLWCLMTMSHFQYGVIKLKHICTDIENVFTLKYRKFYIKNVYAHLAVLNR